MSATMNLLLTPREKTKQTEDNAVEMNTSTAQSIQEPAQSVTVAQNLPKVVPTSTIQPVVQPISQPIPEKQTDGDKYYSPEEIRDKGLEARNSVMLPMPQENKRYNDIIAELEAAKNAKEKPLTPEQKESEEKRFKRNKMFGSISDGIRAIANLMATTQGAPNGYDPRANLSAKEQARWDKLQEKRKQDEAERLNLMLRQYGLEGNKRQEEASVMGAYRQEQDRRENTVYDLYDKYNKAKVERDKNESDAQYRNNKLQSDESYKDRKLKSDEDSKRESNAIARERVAVAREAVAKKSGGGVKEGEKGNYSLKDPQGVTHYFKSHTAWEQAAGYYYPKQVEEARKKSYNANAPSLATLIGKEIYKNDKNWQDKVSKNKATNKGKGAFSSLDITKIK